MDKHLSRSGHAELLHRAGEPEVLRSVVEQLRKDLSVNGTELVTPAPANAFEELRAQVLPVIQRLDAEGDQRLRVAMYRVDIPEPHFRRTMAHGGLDALAGEVVLRALQKVLTRLRFSGRF